MKYLKNLMKFKESLLQKIEPKKEEILIYFDGKEFIEVRLPKTDESLKLIQRLRDEAHRFAKKYHHELRLKKLLS